MFVVDFTTENKNSLFCWISVNFTEEVRIFFSRRKWGRRLSYPEYGIRRIRKQNSKIQCEI